MNKERYSWLRRLAGQILSLIIAAGLIHPAASLAAMTRSNGNGDGGGTGNEGDPLDSNDHSGGGGGGEGDQHEDSAPSVRSGGVISWLPILSSSQRIILIPEFQSGTLIFRVIILETEFEGVEE
jgi:hypothetical protein